MNAWPPSAAHSRGETPGTHNSIRLPSRRGAAAHASKAPEEALKRDSSALAADSPGEGATVGARPRAPAEAANYRFQVEPWRPKQKSAVAAWPGASPLTRKAAHAHLQRRDCRETPKGILAPQAELRPAPPWGQRKPGAALRFRHAQPGQAEALSGPRYRRAFSSCREISRGRLPGCARRVFSWAPAACRAGTTRGIGFARLPGPRPGPLSGPRKTSF